MRLGFGYEEARRMTLEEASGFLDAYAELTERQSGNVVYKVRER